MSLPEWDGVPAIALTYAQLRLLYSYVPQWHGCAVGPPIPFAHGEFAGVEINAIFVKTREEAHEAMVLNIHAACARENIAYVEDEWTITHLVMLNSC
jgi:hypothetical protein